MPSARLSLLLAFVLLLPPETQALGVRKSPLRKPNPADMALPLPPTPPRQAPPIKHEAAARPAPPAADPFKGSVTGLPLPRFASLRADDVNMRAGPGDRYPIEWLYKRRGMPVEIDREFEVWRLVTMPDGTKGWMHEATLMGRRDFLVTGGEHALRERPAQTARVVAMLKPGVVGRIDSCAASAAWCKVQVGAYRGWLARDSFWGTLPKEAVAAN